MSDPLLVTNAQWLVLGDRGDSTKALQTLLAWRSTVHLLTPKRANQKEQLSDELTKDIHHVRHIIETVNSQRVDPVHLQRNRANSLEGLCARVMAKLTAHMVGSTFIYS